MLLEGIPYNLTSLGHVFLSPFVDQEKTRLCSTTKSCWLASEMLTPRFRQTQEITVGLDALIIAKIGKMMSMGSMMSAHFLPQQTCQGENHDPFRKLKHINFGLCFQASAEEVYSLYL